MCASELMVVPPDFGEEVKRAADNRRAGDLALLSYEVHGYEWEMEGWRAVGKAQFDLNALAGAKVTWENVRRIEPHDLEANILLGTIYERLGDLTRSTQALERALSNKDIRSDERAEAYSLLARNSKTRRRDEREPPALPDPDARADAPERKRVLVFTGHMIDEESRREPRFPADKEGVAREKIREAVVREMQTGAGVASAYAGAASGGDILFQEVCAELNIPTRLYLAIPARRYVVASVQKAGADWVERFWKIYKAHGEQVRVLSEAADVSDDSEYLPAWLRTKPDYGIWQRNNLWTLFNALDEGCDPKSDDANITLIALWDGKAGDGPGGTADLVQKVEDLGARSVVIKTTDIF